MKRTHLIVDLSKLSEKECRTRLEEVRGQMELEKQDPQFSKEFSYPWDDVMFIER